MIRRSASNLGIDNNSGMVGATSALCPPGYTQQGNQCVYAPTANPGDARYRPANSAGRGSAPAGYQPPPPMMPTDLLPGQQFPAPAGPTVGSSSSAPAGSNNSGLMPPANAFYQPSAAGQPAQPGPAGQQGAPAPTMSQLQQAQLANQLCLAGFRSYCVGPTPQPSPSSYGSSPVPGGTQPPGYPAQPSPPPAGQLPTVTVNGQPQICCPCPS